MFKIPTVLRADELLDKAFRKAARVSVSGRSSVDRARQRNMSKVNSVTDTVSSTLQDYVRRFPSIDGLPPFYREMIDLLVGTDRLKKSLGAADWCASQIGRLGTVTRGRLKRSRSAEEMRAIRTEFYGRCSSVVKQISDELDFLNTARDALKRMPTIDPSLPTIVVAGAPNVGKSLLVRAISTARPEVAVYPFTTKEISVGILMMGRQRLQVIDTPGLLDRPLEERNPVERRAIAALENLAELILFVLDPSESCGYFMEYQLSLLEGIRGQFPGVRTIVIENKSDLVPDKATDILRVSALSRDGIDALLRSIQSALSDFVQQDI